MAEEERGNVVKRQSCPSRSSSSYSIIAGNSNEAMMSRYLGVGFALFLSLLPKNALHYVSSLQSRNRVLVMRLFEAEEQLKQMRARRREDARANARAAEILAGHRNAWLEAERSLLNRLDEANTVESELRARVECLERELAHGNAEREQAMDGYSEEADREEEEERVEDEEPEENDMAANNNDVSDYGEDEEELHEMAARMYEQGLPSSSFDDAWLRSSNLNPNPNPNSWQGMKYDSIESAYNMKHVIPRRETPWKIDIESSGVPSKLKDLDDELANLEHVGKGDLCKILPLMRKQTKRYQSLSSKIDDICKRLQASDPYDATIRPEFRTQRQTEFLMESYRLQQRATETRHKLSAIQSEILRANLGEELTVEDKFNMKRSLDSMRSNLKEIQRNLEVWLARILGDLEGMLARDGASRMRENYISPRGIVR